MGIQSYPDEERTVHQGLRRASPASRLFRFACLTMLFSLFLAMVGGICVGVIALQSAIASESSEDEGAQARNLLARSYYYGNVTASENVGPTGTAPVSINNATVAMNTATGAISSGYTPSVTLTVGGVGTVGASEPSSEVGATVVNATVTITSTSTTVTHTRTITEAEVLGATSVDSSSEGSETGILVSEPANDCVPATVTLTVTKTGGGAPSAQLTANSKGVAPSTTLVIPDLYSKEVKVGQFTLSSPTLSATSGTAGIQEASEIPATNNNLTTTATVFEQPTVILTSTKIVDNGISSAPVIPTHPADMDNSPCMSQNVTAAAAPSMATVTLSKVITETYTTTVGGSPALTTGVRTVIKTEVLGVEKTVFASGTIGALNNTMTALETITVQPADLPAPEATETAASNGTSPVIVSEGTPSKQGKRGGGTFTGCLVMVIATILCML